MARQQTIFVSGKIGQVIFYERNGVACARSAPAHVRQTKATKQSAKVFGKAKQIGRILRAELGTALAGFQARNIMYRLDKALRQWLGQMHIPGPDLPFIQGLELNERASLKERLKPGLTVDFSERGKVVLGIPGLDLSKDIHAPAHTRFLHLDIGLASCRWSTPAEAGSYSTSIEIPFTSGSKIPKQELILPFKLQKGCMTIVVVSLRYSMDRKRKSGLLTDERWMPVAVVGSCCT